MAGTRCETCRTEAVPAHTCNDAATTRPAIGSEGLAGRAKRDQDMKHELHDENRASSPGRDGARDG